MEDSANQKAHFHDLGAILALRSLVEVLPAAEGSAFMAGLVIGMLDPELGERIGAAYSVLLLPPTDRARFEQYVAVTRKSLHELITLGEEELRNDTNNG